MAPRITFSSETEDYIVFHYQSGKPNRLLMEELGCSENVIYRILEERGVKGVRFREPHTKYSPDEERAMKFSYLSGNSLSQVGKDFGCAHETVYKILLRHNTPMRSVGSQLRTYSDEEISEIMAAWQSGESQQSIGSRLGISQVQVSRVLRLHGYSKEHRKATQERHGHWKGGRIKAGQYIAVSVPASSEFASMRNSVGYVLEHRLVVAEQLGRPLASTETVHHIDGDTTNNDPTNLQLRQGNHGKGAKWHCVDCGSTNVVAVSID